MKALIIVEDHTLAATLRDILLGLKQDCEIVLLTNTVGDISKTIGVYDLVIIDLEIRNTDNVIIGRNLYSQISGGNTRCILLSSYPGEKMQLFGKDQILKMPLSLDELTRLLS